MNGSRRTYRHALSAKFTLREIDICEIVLHRNGAERTLFRTLPAAYAGSRASLACCRTLVLIYAGDEYPPVFRALESQFDDMLWTSLHTCTAGCTFLFVHDRKTCCRVHGNGAELAGGHTVAATETSVGTAGIAAVQCSLYLAGFDSVLIIDGRPVGTAAVTTDNGHHRSFFVYLKS